jgi:hypothetical protein
MIIPEQSQIFFRWVTWHPRFDECIAKIERI